MKKHFKKNVLTLGLVLATTYSTSVKSAGIFVEPMLTYEYGKAEVDLPRPFNSSQSTANGPGLGVRFGAHVHETIFVAFDGRYSMPNYKNSDADVDRTAKSYNYGAVIGFQAPSPIGLRVWAGYIIGGEMDVEKDGEVDFKFGEASGYRIGGGFKIAMLSLNLEYQEINYAKTTLSNAGIFTGSTSNVDQTNKSVVASVSFPVAL
jgi:hypothetical protein